MTTARDDDLLATLAKMGFATHAQRETLAEHTLEVCRIVAAKWLKLKQLRIDDMDDVVQEAAIRALGRIALWDPARAAWRTYVAVVARSAVGERRRQYARDARFVPLPDDLEDLEGQT